MAMDRQRLAMAQRAYREGRLQEAEAGARAVLAEDRGNAEGLHLLGLVALSAGNPTAAAGLLSQALAKGERAEIHVALGAAVTALGRLDQGIAHFRRAIALKPGFGAAHYNLGNALAARGDLAQAIPCFERAVRLDPKNAEAHANLGVALQREGGIDAGVKHLRRAVALAPRNPEFQCGLGEICQQAQRYDDAAVAFEKAVTLAPGLARAWFGLGVARMSAKAFVPAIAAFREAIARDPAMVPAHHDIGIAFSAIGEAEAAEAHFRKATALRPEEPEPQIELADALIAQNREEEALELMRTVCRRHAGSVRALRRVVYLLQSKGAFEEARAAIEELGHVEGEEPSVFCLRAEDRGWPMPDGAIAQALRWRDDPSIARQTRIDVSFALQKVLERAQRFDEAFDCLVSANAAKARQEPYDGPAEATFVENCVDVFTPEFLLTRTSWGNPSDVPVFIVGLPRSGTTLAEQILASHPLAEGAGELFDLDHIVRNLREARDAPFPNGIGKAAAELIRGYADRYLDRRQRAFPNARRIVDKMHMNFRYVGLIALLFPNARFIHCLRNPMDNGLSIFAQQFRPGYAYAYDLAAIGHYYRLHERLMDHWKAILPGRVFALRYEDLVLDPETWSRRLIEFCGLEWDDACLNFHENERAVRTASHWQVRQPLYKTSVERWRRYETRLAPLAEALEANPPPRR